MLTKGEFDLFIEWDDTTYGHDIPETISSGRGWFHSS
jgi:hypothetical protein